MKDSREVFKQTDGADKGQAREPYYMRSKKRRQLKWLVWVLLMIPIIYFAVQVVYIMTPRMRTELAIKETMTDYLMVEGNVMLKSEPVTGQGILYYTVPSGQRVAAGAEVAKVFSSTEAVEAMNDLNAVNEEIQLLEAAQKTLAESGDVDLYLEQMQKAQLQYIRLLQQGEYNDLDDAKNAIVLSGNKVSVATGGTVSFEERIAYLNGQKQHYESIAIPIGSLTTPVTGYFSPAVKYDRIPLDLEAVKQAAPAELQQMLAQPPVYYGSDVVGHIISDYKWSFVAVVPIKEAERFKIGDTSLEISFPDSSEKTSPVKVASVVMDDGAGLAKVELVCDYINPEILQLRVERAKIIFRELTGLRVDKNALRVIEGKQYVYIKFGNQVYLTPIKILLEDEFYLLVSDVKEKGINELAMFDTVVVDSGGMELHDQRIL